MTGAHSTLTLRSKSQRSRSCGYQKCCRRAWLCWSICLHCRSVVSSFYNVWSAL